MTLRFVPDKIHLFIMEEHHEAFFIWNYGYFHGLINPRGNTLLHVDAHDDMCAGGLPLYLNGLEENLSEISDFTYRNLGIANFIVPAVYQGIFNRVYWMKSHNSYKGKVKNMYVSSYNSEGRFFKKGEVNDLFNIKLQQLNSRWGKHQFFTYQEMGVDGNFRSSHPLVLDIDLDYFCCDNSLSSVEKKIEITKDAYQQFCSNRYHWFKTMSASVFSVEEKSGHYYLYCQELQETPEVQIVPQEMIEKRINRFVEFLKQNEVYPQMIDICRSRYSGYTPAEQWEFIEKRLIDALSSLFDLQIHHINDLHANYDGFLREENTCQI